MLPGLKKLHVGIIKEAGALKERREKTHMSLDDNGYPAQVVFQASGSLNKEGIGLEKWWDLTDEMNSRFMVEAAKVSTMLSDMHPALAWG